MFVERLLKKERRKREGKEKEKEGERKEKEERKRRKGNPLQTQRGGTFLDRMTSLRGKNDLEMQTATKARDHTAEEKLIRSRGRQGRFCCMLACIASRPYSVRQDAMPGCL